MTDKCHMTIQECLERVINDGAFAPGYWVSFRVDPSVGGNDPNA